MLSEIKDSPGYSRSCYEKVSDILTKLGMAANLLGYKYLREAILIAYRDSASVSCIMQSIYAPIAKKHGTTVSRLERDMRHAIETVWTKGSLDYIDKCFGYTVDANKGKPSNREFIATIRNLI